MTQKFEIGQTLYYVPRGHGKPENVTISKIGRTWIALSNGHRCDFNLLVDSEYGSRPTCHLSQGAYEQERALVAAWNGLPGRLPRKIPQEMTVEKIAQACAILGI